MIFLGEDFCLMKILVTGTAGFIGSHLCEWFLRKNCKVIGLDNFDEFNNANLKRANISNCLHHSDFKLLEGDILDINCVETIFEKQNIEFIMYLIVKAGVRPAIKYLLGYASVNINGTGTC